MSEPGDDADPKGLIRESYLIDGIDASQCRSIFVDWALSIADGADTPALLDRLIARHAVSAPDHPMSVILRAGRVGPARPTRRGGRAARFQ